MCDTSLNNYIFDPVHNLVIIDASIDHPSWKLQQIPFGGIFSFGIIIAIIFDIVFCFFIDRIVSQMYEAFI